MESARYGKMWEPWDYELPPLSEVENMVPHKRRIPFGNVPAGPIEVTNHSRDRSTYWFQYVPDNLVPLITNYNTCIEHELINALNNVTVE